MLALRRGLVRVLVLLGAAGLTISLATTDASATMGADRFWAGQVYTGEFGSPSVLVVGDTYYAYATNTDGLKLPVMTSRDLVTWRAHPAWPLSAGYSTWAGFNDALLRTAPWAAYSGGKTSVWAPSVAKVGSHYVDAYVVPVPSASQRRCITIATSDSPLGPFRDRTTRPIVCSSQPKGSIDPQIYRAPGGKLFLIWKNSGIPGSLPTEIWARRLAPSGTALAPGTRAHLLLKTARPWEGNVIEAPAMVHYAGRFYLFYSGNLYTSARYATGYATCSGPLGPCRRPTAGPLLATGGGVAGPGAGTPFVDLNGRLRFAYAAWDQGHVGYPTDDGCLDTVYGCNQRRMHIARLSVGSGGLLHVADVG